MHNLLDGDPHLQKEGELLTQDLSRLGHLIEQIILLYRATPENYQARMERLSLAKMAQSAISDCYPQIESRNQMIVTGNNYTN